MMLSSRDSAAAEPFMHDEESGSTLLGQILALKRFRASRGRAEYSYLSAPVSPYVMHESLD